MQVVGITGTWKVGSARTIACAARPLAVGSLPVPDVALWVQPRPSVLSACRPCKGRKSLVPASAVQSAGLAAVLTNAMVRATRGPAEYRSTEPQSERAPARYARASGV